MLRLAVTGSRKFTSKSLVREWIFEAVQEFRIRVPGTESVDWSTLNHVTLIHGKARGFDSLAAHVAADCGMATLGIGADWDGHIGRDAGTSRNWQLIIEGKPNFALVGPGEYGTGHMLGALKSSGILLLDKSDQPIV